MRVPRWAGPVIAIPAVTLFYGVLPWELSLLAPRYGWTPQGPGLANLVGLPVQATGFFFLAWAFALHFASATQGWEMAFTPGYLVIRGPYRYTRNPMYFGGAAILLGWSVFYGSAIVAAGFLMLIVATNFAVVPWEERLLEKVFGERYRRYRDAVPRWIPWARGGRPVRRPK